MLAKFSGGGSGPGYIKYKIHFSKEKNFFGSMKLNDFKIIKFQMHSKHILKLIGFARILLVKHF